MLAVKNIRVLSLDLDYLDVVWEIEDTAEDLQDYSFRVLRSGGPAGPFSLISPPFKDIYLYRDADAPQLRKDQRFYYKIRVTQASTSTTRDYPTTVNGVYHGPELPLVGLEMANARKLLMQEFNGRRVWVFPIRTFGQRCTCWDHNTDRRLRSNCVTCYDTGFVGGFHSPIDTWMQIDPDGTAKQLTMMAEGEVHNTPARLSNFPPLKPRDIIVEAENVRWRVGPHVQTREQLRAIVSQDVVLHEIPHGDIEFRLPINVTLATHEPSPERQFTNPQKV